MLSSLARTLEIRKWKKTISLSLTQYLAYKMNFAFQMIAPALVFYFVKYNLWSSIYDQGIVLKGYTKEQMLIYHFWTLIISLMAKGALGSNMSEDIRMGRITKFLVYPFKFSQYHSASFMAFFILQTIISLVAIAFSLGFGLIELPAPMIIIKAYIIISFIALFWYSLQYMIGILTFWLEETWIFRVMADIVFNFLSGAILPLSFFPELWVKYLKYTPFPYITDYPIQVILGKESSVMPAVLALLGSSIIIMFINSVLWKRGIKHYTGSGI